MRKLLLLALVFITFPAFSEDKTFYTEGPMPMEASQALRSNRTNRYSTPCFVLTAKELGSSGIKPKNLVQHFLSD